MNRSTWVFLFVASGLMAYLYFVEPKQKTTAEREQAEKKLMELNSSKIKRLELVNGDQRIVLIKTGMDWGMETPVKTAADNTAVERLISELEFTQTKRTFKYVEIPKVDETLKEWGLQSPVIRLTMEEEGKKESHVLLVGRKTAVTDAFYVRTSNAPDASVYLIPGSVKTAVDKKADDFRSRSVWRWNTPEVVKVVVKKSFGDANPVVESEAIRAGEEWKLQKPILARGEGEKVRNWLSQLASLQITQFISEDSSNLNAYGLNSPVTQVTLGFDAGKEEQTLLIGSAVPEKQEVYAKRLKQNTVFTLPQAVAKEISDGVAQWRDSHVASFKVEDVVGIRVEQAKLKPLVAKKTKDAWSVSNGVSDFSADPEAIRSFILKIKDLKSTAFIKDTKADVKMYGLDKASARVVIDLAKGEVTEKVEILFGKADKTQLFVTTSSEPFIVAVPPSTVNEFPKDGFLWRDLQVVSLDKNKITRFLRTEKGGTKYGFSRSASGSYVVDGGNQPLEGAEVDAMFLNATKLRAVRWVGAQIPAHDLANPPVRVTLTSDKDEKIIRIGANLPTGGRAALLEGTDTVFEMTLPDVEAFLRKPSEAKPVAEPPVSSSSSQKTESGNK